MAFAITNDHARLTCLPILLRDGGTIKREKLGQSDKKH